MERLLLLLLLSLSLSLTACGDDEPVVGPTYEPTGLGTAGDVDGGGDDDQGDDDDDGSTDGDDGGESTDGAPADSGSSGGLECTAHTDCGFNLLCEPAGECDDVFGRAYEMTRTGELLVCDDGVGGCRFQFTWYFAESGEDFALMGGNDFATSDIDSAVGIDVIELDLIFDDPVGFFWVYTDELLDAWKTDGTVRAYNGDEWVEFKLEIVGL